MRFVIVTGPSGAGKTLALHSFEDAGYYAVDNLPPRLISALIDFCEAEGYDRGAAVIDTRCGYTFAELPQALQDLRNVGKHVELLYLEAADDTLIHRYKETRRPHPLLTATSTVVQDGGIIGAIEAERELLHIARNLADSVLDTTSLTAAQLRDALHSAYAQDSRPGMLVTVTSFGFKHGLPIDADLVFDVRFLTNPYYDPDLQHLDGRDKRVSDFIHNDPLTKPFYDKMLDLINFTLPEYKREGKAYLTVAIGCTGGKHRSVTLAIDLASQLEAEGYQLVLRHRDIMINREQDVLEIEQINRITGKRGLDGKAFKDYQSPNIPPTPPYGSGDNNGGVSSNTQHLTPNSQHSTPNAQRPTPNAQPSEASEK